MTDDTIDRLASSDPARALRPDPAEDLLARTLSLPRTEPRPPWQARRLALRIAIPVAAVAGIAAIAVLVLPHGGDERALAAQAYEQTSPAPGQILHTVVTSAGEFVPDPGQPAAEMGSPTRTEEWHRGHEIHQYEAFKNPGEPPMAVDRTIDADGVMRQVNEEGQYRVIRPRDGEDAAHVIADDQAGFVARFRRSYERGTLDPAGDVTFAGRPARRFVIAATPGGKVIGDDGKGTTRMTMPGPRIEYFVDRDTGAPLGSISAMRTSMANGKTTGSTGTWRTVQTVERIERLDPTAANLAQLRELRLTPGRR